MMRTLTISARVLVLSASALVLAGCRAECVGCQPELDPPAVVATAYRFEVECWEMPLARAESLYGASDEHESSVALVIDAKGVDKPLRELAARDREVRRVEPAEFTSPAGTRALVPPRAARAPGETSWSDGLRLELGAAPTTGWSPQSLDFACAWTSPQGERLAGARGTTPMAPDRGVVVWCLPSRSLAAVPEPRTARAVAAIVRVVPLP